MTIFLESTFFPSLIVIDCRHQFRVTPQKMHVHVPKDRDYLMRFFLICFYKNWIFLNSFIITTSITNNNMYNITLFICEKKVNEYIISFFI